MTMKKLKKLTPITLQQQLYEELTNDINNGKYMPGDKIPTEFELSELYNVSRVTVRAAIQQLVDEDKLVRKAGKGTFVKQAIHVEVVTKGGSFTENCKMRGAKPSTQIIECKLTAGSKEVLEQLVTNSKKVIQVTRVRYVDDVPCIVEIDYFPEEYDFLLSNKIENKSLISYITSNTKIVPAVFSDQFSIEYANKEYSKYLNCPIRTPLLQVKQTVKDKKGKVIYLNKQYILTSKYIYVKQ